MNRTIAGVVLAAMLAGLTAASGTAARQAIFKWVDSEGVVHYTAQPPDDMDYQEIGIETGEARQPAAASETANDDDAAQAREAPPEEPQMTATGPDPKLVAERCAQARDNLARLNERANLVVRGDDGEQRRLSEEDRLRMIDEAQQFIDEWC